MMPQTPPAGKSVGIEATGSQLRVIVLENQTVAQRYEVPFAQDEPLLPRLSAAISQLKSSAGIEVFGIAVSGLVSSENRRLVFSTQFPELTATDVAAELAAQTGARVVLDNDANAAAYGEYVLGAGRGARSMFYATLGAGIGGALVLDGKLWRGTNGFAGEFGYIAINEDGVKLEDVASEGNILRRTRERLFQDSTSSLSRRLIENASSVANIVEAANDGDDFALLMLERTGTYIGTAIASVINLLNVEKVVIGGDIMDTSGILIESIARRAKERSFLPSFDAVQISAAALGADAPAVGAALLALPQNDN